jgi:hypothetical protein
MQRAEREGSGPMPEVRVQEPASEGEGTARGLIARDVTCFERPEW